MDEYENYEYENGKYLIKLWTTRSIKKLDDEKFIEWYIKELNTDFSGDYLLKEKCRDNSIMEKHKNLLNISKVSKINISKIKKELIDIINS